MDVTTRILSNEQITTFQSEGAVLVPGLLSNSWLSIMSEVAEEAKAAAADNANYYGDQGEDEQSTLVADDIFMTNPKMRRFLEDSPIAQVAAEGMGSTRAQIYEDLLLYKASTSSPSPWHQDEPQWPVIGAHMSSIWFSIEATSPETGALQFVAGSHKGPLYIPYVPSDREADRDADMQFFTGGALPDVAADTARFPIRSFSTAPGDVILFHPRTIHAAFGNAQGRPRRTFTVRFLGDDVRWQPKRSVYHDWLKTIDLPAGAPVEHERFPQFWPANA